jgi:hypothetical protein
MIFNIQIQGSGSKPKLNKFESIKSLKDKKGELSENERAPNNLTLLGDSAGLGEL